MRLLDTITNAFRAIPDIGVTPDLRPEETKHIRYLNIGFSLMLVINLAYFFQGLTDAQTPNILQVANPIVSILCVLVFIFNRLGRYTTARVYGFLLYYISCLFFFPLSGGHVHDHYMIFISLGYAFLVFPRKEKKLMALIIILGVSCYFAILVLYEHIAPATQADPLAVKIQNQVTIYITLILFIIFMISGKYFTDQMEDSLAEERQKLAEMSSLLKKMFGRYLSTEVMNSLIENPSALELGGEKRSVTIMMTDLRGFTALSERLQPEQVVQMLNTYFEVMVGIILKYNGTINEIIGDALLIIFGAPQQMPDRAQKAVACAIEMQNAMAQVNQENRTQGLPELEMGIGLNETDVIVGNIGSSQRIKYAAVGSGVNLTSRIESYSVGGQILISESVFKETGDVLRIDAQREVMPKGAETALKIYEVGGIAAQYNLSLERKDPAPVFMAQQVPLQFSVLEGKDAQAQGLKGAIVRLSKNSAEMILNEPLKILSNLKMNLVDVDEKLSTRDFYGKVVKHAEEQRSTQLVRFTAVPPEIDAYFQALRQYATKPSTS